MTYTQSDENALAIARTACVEPPSIPGAQTGSRARRHLGRRDGSLRQNDLRGHDRRRHRACGGRVHPDVLPATSGRRRNLMGHGMVRYRTLLCDAIADAPAACRRSSRASCGAAGCEGRRVGAAQPRGRAHCRQQRRGPGGPAVAARRGGTGRRRGVRRAVPDASGRRDYAAAPDGADAVDAGRDVQGVVEGFRRRSRADYGRCVRDVDGARC